MSVERRGSVRREIPVKNILRETVNQSNINRGIKMANNGPEKSEQEKILTKLDRIFWGYILHKNNRKKVDETLEKYSAALAELNNLPHDEEWNINHHFTSTKYTLLECAAFHDAKDLIPLLFKYGADPDETNAFKQRPIDRTTRDETKALLEQGYSCNIKPGE